MNGPARILFCTAMAVFAARNAGAQITNRPAEPPAVSAESQGWYMSGEPITDAGNLYYPAGPRVFFNGNEMVPSGSYLGVALYTRTTIEPYSVVFVPLSGGLLQPYERRRTGELAGTVGSSAPSFPVSVASEAPASQGIGATVQAPYSPTVFAPVLGPAAAAAPAPAAATVPVEPTPPGPVGTAGRILTPRRILTPTPRINFLTEIPPIDKIPPLLIIKLLVEPFERVSKRLLPQAGTSHSMLLETPVHAAQYCLDGIVHNGSTKPLGVVDAVMFPGTQAFMRFDYPSQLGANVQNRALAVATEFLKAIGFTHGMFNMEFFYDAATETGFRFDDDAVGIAWPVTAAEAVVSGRDRQAPTLQELLKTLY